MLKAAMVSLNSCSTSLYSLEDYHSHSVVSRKVGWRTEEAEDKRQITGCNQISGAGWITGANQISGVGRTPMDQALIYTLSHNGSNVGELQQKDTDIGQVLPRLENGQRLPMWTRDTNMALGSQAPV
ncbi:hypothetical protein CRUP_016307 [Coryphaenoides rupestris]|nr:hypothetical protein CRUP_016307 [Coryphaenoides rupestris]